MLDAQRLDRNALDKVEQALRHDRGSSVLRTLSRLGLGDPLDEEGRAVAAVLAQLGLGRRTAAGIVLNRFGYKCADAAREYVLWIGRARQLHGEDTLPALMLGNFANKRVLEIGPGSGCNLFRLQQATPYARGCEIEEVYPRFASIFAKMEGVEPPAIDLGDGENLPYADGSFDWVLMFSALQYMDIKAAVREAARVLTPGGRLLSAQPLLQVLLADLRRAFRKPRALIHKSTALVNSLSYRLFGQRMLGKAAGGSTHRPVYLTHRQIISIVEDAGLHFLPSLSAEKARDFVFVAEKPTR